MTEMQEPEIRTRRTMPLRVYNTYSKQKEPFIPLKEGEVKFYCCGPTVYDYFHIGNARPFIVFDVFRRYLLYRGYRVTYVVNLTDIEDKIIRRASEEGISAAELAERYIAAYFEDADALGIRRADVYPRATQHVPEMIALIQTLVEKGYAYVVEGSVYYDVSKFSDYGQLSGKNIEELQAGARVEVDERKDDPLDFVLWKKAKEGEPWWESPWGPGRPGWHIECSAMATKYLGESFDIHAGGVDLIFPHHENEIAQSEAATGKRFVRYWLHNGFLTIEGQKMAKSVGNVLVAREVLKRFSRAAVRHFYLSKHYRSPINYSEDELAASERAVERLTATVEKIRSALKEKGEPATLREEKLTPEEQHFRRRLSTAQREFFEAMDDDFNTAAAIAKLFELAREVNVIVAGKELSANLRGLLREAEKLFIEWDDVLGILDLETQPRRESQEEALLRILVDVRHELRRRKEWALADFIRDRLGQLGVMLDDGEGGSFWRRTKSLGGGSG